jgi:hypothetical protein
MMGSQQIDVHILYLKLRVGITPTTRPRQKNHGDTNKSVKAAH